MFPPQTVFPPDGTDPRQLVRTMQIICGALMTGVIIFAFVAFMVRFVQKGQPAAAVPMMAYMAAGMAGVMIAARFAAAPLIVKSGLMDFTARWPIDEIRKLDFYPIYQNRMIYGCALLNGAVFFNLISVIVEGQIWTFAIVGVLLALMAASFPTYERVDAWADEQLRLLQLDPPR